jgi:hypothetical protein
VRDDPLYVSLKKVLVPGDMPRTAQDIAVAFDRSEVQAKRVLDWMSTKDNPLSMAELPGMPTRWRRI